MTVSREGIFANAADGHDAGLGQRWRVAHMPAAATTNRAQLDLVKSGDRKRSKIQLGNRLS